VWGWVDPLGLCGEGPNRAIATEKLPMTHPFTGGGTHITTSTSLDRFPGSQTFGGPGGLFIAPSSQVDNLLLSSATRTDIEMALGLPKGQLSGGNLIRIDVQNPFSRNLRLPTEGNEFFRPGVGLTTGNLNEGIIKSPLKSDVGVISTTIKGL